LANFSFVADTKSLFHTPIVNQVLNNWTFGMTGTLQSGRPYPVSTGDGAFTGSNFPALGAETNQRPNVCGASSTIAGCAGLPVGTLVSTNIGSISGSNYEVSQTGITACTSLGIVGCPTVATTFAAPAGASTHGPLDSIDGKTPVDFQYISGNLARNMGQSLALYRFDISLTKAIKIPKWESSSLELKFEAFNVFNHPLFISNDANDVLNFFSLPALKVHSNPNDPKSPLIPNPNYTCTGGCINPLNGQYLGNDGKLLNINNFQRATFNQAKNYLGLGGPAATVTPRILQLAFRFRW
jgi:hypothetical protein